jgi:hypothetical protein
VPVALVFALGVTARAEAPVDPEPTADAIAAFVAAGGDTEDPALGTAREALARCRTAAAAGRIPEARRACDRAEAALSLARERALLALARARSARR